MECVLDLVHQLENVISRTMRMPAEGLIGLSEHVFQVMKLLIHLLQVAAQVMDASVLVRDQVNMSGRSIQLHCIRMQVSVARLVSVVLGELLDEFAGLRLQLDCETINVVVGIRFGRDGRERQRCQSKDGQYDRFCKCHGEVSRC